MGDAHGSHYVNRGIRIRKGLAMSWDILDITDLVLTIVVGVIMVIACL